MYDLRAIRPVLLQLVNEEPDRAKGGRPLRPPRCGRRGDYLRPGARSIRANSPLSSQTSLHLRQESITTFPVVRVDFHDGFAGRAVHLLFEVFRVERAGRIVGAAVRAAPKLDEPGEVVAGSENSAAGLTEKDATPIKRAEHEVAVAVGTADRGGMTERHDPVGREFKRLRKVEGSAAGALQVFAAFHNGKR